MDNETIVLINDNKLSELKLERLFALKALKENISLLDNVFTFEKLCYVFNNLKANVETIELANILMIAKAIKTLKNLNYNHEWNNEIKQYIAHIAHSEGWLQLPEILSFAQDALKDLHQHEDELNSDQIKLQELKHKALATYIEMG